MGRTIFIVDDREKYAKDIKLLLTKGIRVVNSSEEIGGNTRNIICSTSLKSTAKFIEAGNSLDNLIIQDGFIGSNILERNVIPEKLRDTKYFQGDVISLDVKAAEIIMRTKKEMIGNIYMLGLNVEEYLTDSRFAREALNIINKQKEIFRYYRVYIEHCEDGWMSNINLMNTGKPRNVNIAVGYKGE